MISTSAYFEDIEWEIKKILNAAKNSVRICVAWISREVYGSTLLELAQRGVLVEVVYNGDLTNLNHGLKFSPHYHIFPIRTRLSSALMHNKFCIVDDEIVITGSYNWSKKAKESFENIVVIKNNFKLVKSFRFEFFDLINYYRGFDSNQVFKCQCRSNSFTLAIMGRENGIYDESKIDIWSVCAKNHHVTRISEEYEQFLQTQVGMKNGVDWDTDPYGGYSKELMLSELQEEIRTITSLQNYFNSRSGVKIHAVGMVNISNENEQIEYSEEPEYVINVLWRDMFYRKIIPEIFYDDGYDGINRIISEHI